MGKNDVMKHDFWHSRWEEGRIGFHQQQYHPALSACWDALNIADSGRVFVPLCGKSRDMLWLADQGYQVLGNELSESACRAFFTEAGMAVTERSEGAFVSFRSASLELLCGDFFELNEDWLEGVAAVYDRAALIALPPEMRRDYAARLCRSLPKGVEILLVTLEFEGEQGPPFAVSQSEVEALFAARFRVERLQALALDDPRDKGRAEAVYRLTECLD